MSTERIKTILASKVTTGSGREYFRVVRDCALGKVNDEIPLSADHVSPAEYGDYNGRITYAVVVRGTKCWSLPNWVGGLLALVGFVDVETTADATVA